ncbi:MAG: acyl--CoA ligase [Candidatus Obscuribacter phosphatis]|uniref:Acyl--CoA ligase n=1 Tax=Candidatus Obscuribacter phosphatis TaxID=1906157 RepID=A0A8J7PD71_9BACT|nr:acyl--CoA ligase [Candidatus Obscuribacter phosphatis]
MVLTQENNLETINLIQKLVMPDLAAASPDAPALIQITADGERKLSYRDLRSLIDKAESRLQSCGLKTGEKLLILAPNSPEVVAALLAAFRLGALAVPVDFRMTLPELTNIAEKLAVKHLLSTNSVLQQLKDDFSAFANGHTLTAIETIENEVPSQSVKDREKVTDHRQLTDPAFLILTSGTTGMPKGALHDLHSLVHNIKELAEMAALTDGKKLVLPVPLSHVLGLEVTMAALLGNGCVIIAEMSVEGIIKANNLHQPEFLVGVPTIYGAILTLPKELIDLSKAEVLLCGGAPLPLSLAEEFEKKFAKRLNNGYGSTESKIIAVNLEGPRQSVGKVVPSCRIEILPIGEEANNKPLSDGETGEIVICGPTLMLGYIGQAEATAAVMRDGGYRTGDIGYMQDGYLYVMGRNKEMIIVAGNKVFPAEVESVLRKCPLVKDVAIIGVAHSRLGQIVKAHIILGDEELSAALTAEETKREASAKAKEQLRSYCQENLKRELRPMEWVFYPASHVFAKTFSGKVDKKQLS